MNAKRIWTTCALVGLAVLATASIGSSAQGPQGKQATDAGSTLGETGTPFCFGDGSSGKCADFYPGQWGRGCENSLSLGGGRLRGHGSARLCDDNLVLGADTLPIPTTVVFLESSDAVTQGMGQTFGDGLLCLNRNIRHIAVKLPRKLGMASYPMFGDAPLSIDGKVSVLQPTRYYQVMYRDPGILGRGSHFNLTNALMVVWGP